MYREIRTMEEAESFLGKVIKRKDGREMFCVIEIKYGKEDILINGYTPLCLWHDFLCDGNRVAIWEDDNFELPVLNDDMKKTIKFLGISEVEAQIRMYVQNIGRGDKNEWDEIADHYSIFYDFECKEWSYSGVIEYKSFEIYIDTKGHAKELSELLNKNNIKP